MIVKPRLSCESCIKPVARRLALFEPKDEYECYAESYVKCFWGLCDLHKSDVSLVPKAINQGKHYERTISTKKTTQYVSINNQDSDPQHFGM